MGRRTMGAAAPWGLALASPGWLSLSAPHVRPAARTGSSPVLWRGDGQGSAGRSVPACRPQASRLSAGLSLAELPADAWVRRRGAPASARMMAGARSSRSLWPSGLQDPCSLPAGHRPAGPTPGCTVTVHAPSGSVPGALCPRQRGAPAAAALPRRGLVRTSPRPGTARRPCPPPASVPSFHGSGAV